MFFILSKTIGFFALPSNLVILVGIVGAALLFTRFARTGRRLVVACVAALLLIGMFPLGGMLIYGLEQRFPPWDPARGPPYGIIVLGGAIDPDMSAAHGETALNDAAERMTSIDELARRYPSPRIVYSGGSGERFRERVQAGSGMPLIRSVWIAR